MGLHGPHDQGPLLAPYRSGFPSSGVASQMVTATPRKYPELPAVGLQASSPPKPIRLLGTATRAAGAGGSVSSSVHVAVSQSWMVPSGLAAARRLPSGLQAAAHTRS